MLFSKDKYYMRVFGYLIGLGCLVVLLPLAPFILAYLLAEKTIAFLAREEPSATHD